MLVTHWKSAGTKSPIPASGACPKIKHELVPNTNARERFGPSAAPVQLSAASSWVL
jgi:hypothetical protein